MCHVLARYQQLQGEKYLSLLSIQSFSVVFPVVCRAGAVSYQTQSSPEVPSSRGWWRPARSVTCLRRLQKFNKPLLSLWLCWRSHSKRQPLMAFLPAPPAGCMWVFQFLKERELNDTGSLSFDLKFLDLTLSIPSKETWLISWSWEFYDCFQWSHQYLL